MNGCLHCYDPLADGEVSYHSRCSKRLFDSETAPEVEFGLDEVEKEAEKIIHARLAVTGVQPKVPVELKLPSRGAPERPVLSRVTFPSVWGRYILKPPHKDFPFMPEIEDLTMLLAEVCGIRTAVHGLVRLRSGELAYIAKRFDRLENNRKLPMEDMCQLTGLLTEDKYHSSMEKVGKAISKYSSNPGNDLLTFLEVTLFSFLIGNADMHLKNFSLLTDEEGQVGLSPAYDLLATKLLTPDDGEEMALPIHGKKNRLKKGDFLDLAQNLDVPAKAADNLLKRFKERATNLGYLISRSLLSDELKKKYSELLVERGAILFG